MVFPVINSQGKNPQNEQILFTELALVFIQLLLVCVFFFKFLLDQNIFPVSVYPTNIFFFLKAVSAKRDVSAGVSKAQGGPLVHDTVSGLAFFFSVTFVKSCF